MKVIIITGASSGMGKESALQLDKIYGDIIDEFWLISRRVERLEALSKTLKHKCRILPFDLCDEKDMAEFELSLSLLNPNIRLLINAAGYGLIGDFSSLEKKNALGMIRLNCEALTNVTHVSLPYMKKGSRIIQFASSAAFLPQIGFSVYAATKSYVLSFSKALNYELKPKGISVTAVCPGPVNTEFFKVAGNWSDGFGFKKYFMAEDKDVIRLALYDAYKRKSISVYSLPMKLLLVLTKIVPHDLILRIMTIIK